MIKTKDLIEFLHDPVNWCLVDELHHEYVGEIVAIIKNQPTITEEWIEEKAKELLRWWDAGGFVSLKPCKDFIRLLVEEIK